MIINHPRIIRFVVFIDHHQGLMILTDTVDLSMPPNALTFSERQ